MARAHLRISMLNAGTRLGSYEILGSLGAGGMGEVYRARDTRLDRDVAIKILPELFATDPERLTRFDREAKTLGFEAGLCSKRHRSLQTTRPALHGTLSMPASTWASISGSLTRSRCGLWCGSLFHSAVECDGKEFGESAEIDVGG
jgi:serine/threonine protein kinase